jgi:hypothetical protein
MQQKKEQMERQNWLANEWLCLQNQFDSYEKFSLMIKLFNLLLLFITVLISAKNIFILGIFTVIWLQDAIWKTFQSRIEQRLIIIEQAINKAETIQPLQFNLPFINSRGGFLALILQYLKQAIRPTVAFPHLLIVFSYVLLL